MSYLPYQIEFPIFAYCNDTFDLFLLSMFAVSQLLKFNFFSDLMNPDG